MKRTGVSLSIIALLILSCTMSLSVINERCAGKGLADSPWPSYRGGAQNTGWSPYRSEAFEGDIQWKYSTGRYILSSPSIGTDGTIYIGSGDGNLHAVTSNGMSKWTFTTGGEIRSSPAIGEDGTLYFGSRDKNVYAVKSNGNLRWKYNTGGEVDSSPVINSDGDVIVGSSDGYVYSIDGEGKLNWKYELGGKIISSPALDSDGHIYIGSYNGIFCALNEDGEKRWELDTNSSIRSSPSVDDSGVIYFGCVDKKLYALNQDGEVKWSYKTKNWIDSTPAIDPNGVIYVGSTDKTLYAVEPDGDLKWKYKISGYIRSSPSISSDGKIFIPSTKGELYVLNREGKLLGEYKVGNSIYSTPAIDSYGDVYIGSNDGNLYCLGAKSEEKTPSAPRYLEAETGDIYVNLSWSKPSQQGGSSIKKYNVYRGVGEGDFVYLYSINSTRTYFRDGSVSKGKTYRYIVTASNAHGESNPSNSIEVSVDPGDEDDSGLFGFKSDFLFITMLVLTTIFLIAFAITWRRMRFLETKYKDTEEEEKEDVYNHQQTYTCPYCGYVSTIPEERSEPIRCPQCKSWIQPSR